MHLQNLPLEVFSRAGSRSEPFAIVEHQRIVACDAKSLTRGIRPQMALAAAQVLAPALRTRERDPAGETEALLGLASWATRFTPSVALDFPDGLALEVAGSVRLFGGIQALLDEMRVGLRDMGYSAGLAVAPTAKAAAWLSRTDRGRKRESGERSAQPLALASIPLCVLRFPAKTLEACASLGVGRLGELLALPRDGLARRFGQRLLDELDRGLGRLPDPRNYYVPPEQFRARLELPAEVLQSEALLFACNRLLTQMAAFLAGRGNGVQRFTLCLFHRESRKTELAIGLVEPSRDPRHFSVLLRERLAGSKLREPVRAIELIAADIVPCGTETDSLLPQEACVPGDWVHLVERLCARLGPDAVQGLDIAPEHRPERASCLSAPGDTRMRAPRPNFGERPLWLLGTPRALEERDAIPHYGGPLELVSGPERIESGWWDEDDIGRDYFIARTDDESLVWIYREHRALEGGRWYLHGLFS